MILLDTCALLWYAQDRTRLSPRARAALAAPEVVTHVSAITAWEITLKHTVGRLHLPLDPWEWYQEAVSSLGLVELPLDARVAHRAAALPLLHRDPADRFLTATALVHGMKLLTPDPLIHPYEGLDAVW